MGKLARLLKLTARQEEAWLEVFRLNNYTELLAQHENPAISDKAFIDALNAQLQKKQSDGGFMRDVGERHEVAATGLSADQVVLFDKIRDTGIWDERFPSREIIFDSVAVLGAQYLRIKMRLEYLAAKMTEGSIMLSADCKFYLLGSERGLFANEAMQFMENEGVELFWLEDDRLVSREQLVEICERRIPDMGPITSLKLYMMLEGKKLLLNEASVHDYMGKKILPKGISCQTTCVTALAGDVRAKTEHTLPGWIESCKEGADVIAITNAPYLYQDIQIQLAVLKASNKVRAFTAIKGEVPHLTVNALSDGLDSMARHIYSVKQVLEYVPSPHHEAEAPFAAASFMSKEASIAHAPA